MQCLKESLFKMELCHFFKKRVRSMLICCTRQQIIYLLVLKELVIQKSILQIILSRVVTMFLLQERNILLK